MRQRMKEVMETMGTKHCPECGSTNIHPSVFYRPSIWECSDCGHEGAFIIENNTPTQYQEQRERGYHAIAPIDRLHPEDTNISADNWPKT
jgi:ribosomal protein L37AE/L43A